MDSFVDQFPYTMGTAEMSSAIEQAKADAKGYARDKEILKLVFSCIDITSLNTEDSSEEIREFALRVNGLKEAYPFMPQVGAMCVYPVFAPTLKSSLKAEGVNIATVSAGFPSSQTFLDVKKLETERAIAFGANEIDIVISVGEFLEGNYEFVGEEVKAIKSVMGKAHLKVILETGALKEADKIWTASMLSMFNGADFIKTSTGKQQPAATFEAAFVMLHAIKRFEKETKVKVGFKPAGGIATPEDALVYYALVKNICGDEWLNNKLFRIGASRLANALIADVAALETGQQIEVKYF